MIESQPVGTLLTDIFQPNPNDRFILNIPALTTLIQWAEGDDALAARFGTWDQGVWARALVGDPDLNNSSWDEASAKYRTMDDAEAEEQARNGVCQTAYCMAGQTVAQAGYRLIYQFEDYEDDEGDETGLGAHASLITSDCIKQEWTGRFDDKGKPVMRDTGEVMPIAVAAANILGLDDWERVRFFDGGNGVEDLKHMVNAFCRRRGLPEQYPEVYSHRAEDMVATIEDRPFME